MGSTTQRTGRPVLTRVHFGEFLLERQAITDQQLLDALADHWASGRRVGDVLVRKGSIEREAVERLAEEYQNLQTVYV
jgi:hypothetical protein